MSARRPAIEVGDLALLAGERRNVGALVDGALARRDLGDGRGEVAAARASAGGPRRLR